MVPLSRSKRWNSFVHPRPSVFCVSLVNVEPGLGWVGPSIPSPPKQHSVFLFRATNPQADLQIGDADEIVLGVEFYPLEGF